MRKDGNRLVGIPTPEARAAAMAGVCDVRATSTWPALAAAGVPILLLLASEPPELGAQNEAQVPRFRDTFPQAEVHVVPDAGHSLLTDAPDEVARRVGDWLAGLEAQVPARRRLRGSA